MTNNTTFNAHILVVDDNSTNRKVAVTILHKLGCTTEMATNGLEAVELASEKTYDLIFMNCQMPEMDGYAATRAIRKIENGKKHVPIVAMTAGAMVGDSQKCIESGMDGYVTKPIRIANIKEILESKLPKSKVNESKEIKDFKTVLSVDLSVIEELREMADDDEPESISSLINIFLEDATGYLSYLRDALHKNDFAALYRIAHALKGSSSNLGVVRLAELAAEVEEMAEQSNSIKITNLVGELENEFKVVCLILDGECNK